MNHPQTASLFGLLIISSATAQVVPARPTVISSSTPRPLVNNKPFEVPLELLSQEDWEFAKNVRATHTKKAAVSLDKN